MRLKVAHAITEEKCGGLGKSERGKWSIAIAGVLEFSSRETEKQRPTQASKFISIRVACQVALAKE